ncbi:MAG TPA: outer membrane beta-barrel protein [Thermoanaerobaculia bacterium]|nr:outer membrane beta-barrel protein [Thermoanaerobaculia bacterium]
MRKLIVVLLLLIPSSVFAQSFEPDRDERWRERRAPALSSRAWNMFEITPFGGYRYGGTIYADRSGLFGFDSDVASNGNVGVNLGIPLGRTPLKLELMVNQQKTHLTGSGLFEPDVRLADFDVTYYHAGLQVPFGDPRGAAVPFLVLSGGVANLRPDIRGVQAENRFSASAGLGVKVPFNRNVGLRVEARGYFTSLGDDDCRGCYYYDDYNDLYQGETNIGLVISF